jgi:hypothetical protein
LIDAVPKAWRRSRSLGFALSVAKSNVTVLAVTPHEALGVSA